jgi:hypothetical protein
MTTARAPNRCGFRLCRFGFSHNPAVYFAGIKKRGASQFVFLDMAVAGGNIECIPAKVVPPDCCGHSDKFYWFYWFYWFYGHDKVL